MGRPAVTGAPVEIGKLDGDRLGIGERRCVDGAAHLGFGRVGFGCLGLGRWRLSGSLSGAGGAERGNPDP